MKECVTCGKKKKADQFNFRNKSRGVQWNTCKQCQSEQRRRWYKKNRAKHKRNVKKHRKRAKKAAREMVWDYLSRNPCVDCGESDPVVLEFDHVRGKKEMNITDMVRAGYSKERLRDEIGKCEVRCANCHRRKTSRELGWFRK